MPEPNGLAQVESWFKSHNWDSFEFQRQVWNAYTEGKSGLIHSATGSGKTLAGWFGPVIEWLNQYGPSEKNAKRNDAPGLRVLWITPLRALAGDTTASLIFPLDELGVPWTVELRTGDSTNSERSKQRTQLQTALVTTPESLSLLLTHPDDGQFDNLECIVVDEWHELISTKRGVQTELALARLRTIRPNLRIWGISATLGNLRESMETLLGRDHQGVLIQGESKKEVTIDSLLPANIQRFPWSGHLGLSMLPQVVEAIYESRSCLVFTNTRATAELWYQRILELKPEWKDVIGLHHGSLDRAVRDGIEHGLKTGELRAVVCTSSLDLGVDFSPVDRVLQVGSPKGVARLLQRAGRSGHQPGVTSRATCVPTHALELVDIAAAKDAVKEGKIESREGVLRPLDLLAQHVVTCALGGGFVSEELLQEVRTTHSFKSLSQEEWDWVLEFVTIGGKTLQAYDGFKRVVRDGERYVVKDKEIAQRHRMSIGTIVSDAAMNVQYLGGSRLGTVEESFVARLKPGDKFVFSGKPLEFIRARDMTAWVKKAKNLKGAIPRWNGGRMPLSSELSKAIRVKLEEAKYGVLDGPEMQMLGPLLKTQAEWSVIPAVDEFLIERLSDREGFHMFFYPMEGRLVHEGLAALFAYRMSRLKPITFTIACNDYGFELLSEAEPPLRESLDAGLLSTHGIAEDIIASLNSAEMARRQFREVARVAGLIFQGFPGAGKSAKQLQASSGLFFDVFERFDPENMLLRQSYREVLERQLEQSRLTQTLLRLSDSKMLLSDPPHPTPIAFPILVDRLRETISSESVSDQIERMSLQLEAEAG